MFETELTARSEVPWRMCEAGVGQVSEALLSKGETARVSAFCWRLALLDLYRAVSSC